METIRGVISSMPISAAFSRKNSNDSIFLGWSDGDMQVVRMPFGLYEGFYVHQAVPIIRTTRLPWKR
jgi:hypothetical protein